MTQTESERKAFRNCRRKGIGGSDVAGILGLSKWNTPLDVYLQKVEGIRKPVNQELVHFGHVLEDVVAKRFCARTGWRVQRVNKQLTGAKLLGKEYDFCVANIDRAVIFPNGSQQIRENSQRKVNDTGLLLNTDAILECKTTSAYTASEWGNSQEDEIKDGYLITRHKIPIYYETQCQWYMAITGASICYLAVLIGGNDFRMYAILRDDELIKMLLQKATEFWHRHVRKKIPPEPMSKEDLLKLFPKSNGNMVRATNETAALIGDYKNLQATIKGLQRQLGAIQEKIILEIGENDGIMLDGKKFATYKSQTRKTFDSKSFKEDNPRMYQEYVKRSSSRVFKAY